MSVIDKNFNRADVWETFKHGHKTGYNLALLHVVRMLEPAYKDYGWFQHIKKDIEKLKITEADDYDGKQAPHGKQ